MRAFTLFPAQTLGVIVCDFALGTLVYAGCLYILLPDKAPLYYSDWHGWMRIALAVFSIIIGLYFNELYRNVRIASRVALILQLSHVLGMSLVIQTLLAYVNSNVGMPRRVVLLATIAGFPAFFFWRLLYSSFLWKLFGQQTIVLVGNGALAQDLGRKIAEKPQRGIRLAGYVGDPVPEADLHATFLGPYEDLPSIVSDLKPDRVVVACSDRRGGGMPVEQLIAVRRKGIPIEEGSRVYELLCRRVCSAEFLPAQFIFDRTLVHRPGSLALQAIYINLLGLAGIVLLMPVLILIALLVKIFVGGTVLDPVPCVGYRGIPFDLQRFRVKRALRGENRFVVNRFGRFLRKSRLETLPLLFNLMRGEMALVGPRPTPTAVAEEMAERIPFYEHRYSLKPGLTGWSQINADSPNEPPDALVDLEYDLYYLKNISLSLDAYILLYRLRRLLTFA